MADSTRLRMPYLAAAQSQKHVTLNDALQVLDALVQIAVLARNRAAPPDTPAEGDRYLVDAAATGAFAGKGGLLACFEDGAWRFHQPRRGWIAFVQDEATLRIFDGTAWLDVASLIRSLSGLAALGVGATPDAGNPFAVKINGGYFTARPVGEGGSGDLRLTLGKEAPGRTASLVYQSAWSARAETGLTGDDAYRIKVSADGAAWREALVADPASGAVRFPGGIADVAGAAPGGLRNLIVNGEFSVAQRGPGPFALAAGQAWTLDRWAAVAAGAVTGSVSRAAIAAGGPPGQALSLMVAAAAAGASLELVTRLEDVTRLAGRTATLSFWYRAPASGFSVGVEQQFGTGGSALVVVAAASMLPSSAGWTPFTLKLAVPAVAQKTIAADAALAIRIRLAAAAPATLDLAAVQLEEGPVATPFERRPAALELLLCRRFLRVSASALNPADLALEMRAAPAASGAGPFVYSAEL